VTGKDWITRSFEFTPHYLPTHHSGDQSKKMEWAGHVRNTELSFLGET
jgi:hypothetical protein